MYQVGWPSGLGRGSSNFTFLGPSLLPTTNRLNFLMQILFLDSQGVFRVRFPAGNAHFSTPFNTQGTTFPWLLLTYSICPRNMVRRKVAEIGLNQEMSQGYLAKKVSKLNDSKFTRENSIILFWGYTHIKPMPPIPPAYPQMSMSI